MKKLTELGINSKNLKSISWKDISLSMTHLQITGGGSMLNDIHFIKRDIQMVKNSDICLLQISNAGLTEIDCTKLPKKIESLIFSNNNLKNFDTKTALTKLESLGLSNNKLEKIVWENLPASLYSINVENNQLTTIGSISHFTMFGNLYAKGNKITSLCFAKDGDWSVFSRYRRLPDIDLGENRLSYLPNGFEKLECLRKLCLNNNKFDYNSKNLEEELWNRLPSNLLSLNLNYNTLNEISCSLKRLTKLNILEVVDCKLTKICSHILTLIVNRRPLPFRELYMDIRKNPLIKNIPYIPRNISKDISYPTQHGYDKITYNLLIDNLDLIHILTHKIKYDFKECEEISNICKCCVKCGAETNEKPIKQLFTIDLTMVLELENLTKKKEYPKGKWRTNVNARICSTCLNTLKEIIISEEFKSLQLKTLAIIRGKRKNSDSQNVLNGKDIEKSENPSLNDSLSINIYHSEVVPNLNTEISENTERLPSIEHILPIQRYETNFIHQSIAQANHNYFVSYNSQDNIASSSYYPPNEQQQLFTDSNIMIDEHVMQDESNEMFYDFSNPSNNSILYDTRDSNFDPKNL